MKQTTLLKAVASKQNIDQSALTQRRQARLETATTMFGSLLFGTVLSIGHHFFYQYLDGKDVDGTVSQSWTTNIATAIAFLVKMFLTIAAGAAFVQYQWRDLQKKLFRVDEVDSMTAMLQDARNLLHIRLWFRVPVLVVIAVVTWLVPIAVVFPPGTLSIVFSTSRHISEIQVPQLAFFNSSNFHTRKGSPGDNNYSDAAPVVYRTALAAGTSGQVLNVPHIFTNMSYSLQFAGPAIQCTNASSELTDIAVSHINVTGSGGGVWYASFVGGDDHDLFNASELICNSWQNYTTCYREQFPFGDTQEYESLDLTSNDTARLYVLAGYNLTECKLYNATYDVDFSFMLSNQTTTVRKVEYHNQVASNRTGPCLEDTPESRPYNIQDSYMATMEAFGSLFVGELSGKIELPQRFQTLIQTLSVTPPNWSNQNTTSTEDFQSQIETLFQNITLSMLSHTELTIQNASQAESVIVTRITYPAVYRYEPLVLCLAYGSAILGACICALTGVYAMHANGATYANKFSSLARLARVTGLYELISETDDASNPCPNGIKQAKMRTINEQQDYKKG